jgi:hypothetical protein
MTGNVIDLNARIDRLVDDAIAELAPAAEDGTINTDMVDQTTWLVAGENFYPRVQPRVAAHYGTTPIDQPTTDS